MNKKLLNPFVREWQCEEILAFRAELDIMSDTELVLNCNMEDDFDPPPTWENMSEKQTITYKFVSEYELHMLFENDENI